LHSKQAVMNRKESTI